MVKAPPYLRPYIEAIGIEHTIQLLLTFGGGMIYVAEDPGADSAVATAIGLDRARALGKALGKGHVKVPVAKGWIARQLFASGWPKGKIGRRLHVTDETVRLYLKGQEQGTGLASSSSQLDLFG